MIIIHIKKTASIHLNVIISHVYSVRKYCELQHGGAARFLV